MKILRALICGIAVAGLTLLTAVVLIPSAAGAVTKTTVSFEGTGGVPANYIFPS
jgi:cell division septal protein FtsQ